MITKITKKEYPDIWDNIINEWVDLCKSHRKGSSFYANPVYCIDTSKEWFKDIPKELDGCWQSEETLYWTDAWGLERNPTVLIRVESIPITIYGWKPVEVFQEKSLKNDPT